MCQFPEHDAIQILVHMGGVVRVLMELRPAGECGGQLPRQTSALFLGNGRNRAHHTSWPPLTNNPMLQKGESVIDMREMGFVHMQRQLQMPFPEGRAFLTDGLGMLLVLIDDDHIGISAVSESRFLLAILANRNWPTVLDAEVPRPARAC